MPCTCLSIFRFSPQADVALTQQRLTRVCRDHARDETARASGLVAFREKCAEIFGNAFGTGKELTAVAGDLPLSNSGQHGLVGVEHDPSCARRPG